MGTDPMINKFSVTVFLIIYLFAGLTKLTSTLGTPAVIPPAVVPLVPTQAGVLPPPGIAIPQPLPVAGAFRAPQPAIIPGIGELHDHIH